MDFKKEAKLMFAFFALIFLLSLLFAILVPWIKH